MKKFVWFLTFVVTIGSSLLQATEIKKEVKQEVQKVVTKEASKQMTPKEVYDRMVEILSDSWYLSEEKKQIDTTGAHKNKAIAHLVGDDEAVGTRYKVIGRGATLEEVLLPDTMKSMVTMYHCNSFKNCTQLKATHYCAKQNQPEFILNLEETTPNKFVFDCDMSTELCNSSEDHIHKMIFELSDDDDHLKASYLAWKDKKLREKHSIYHFDRM